MGFCLSVPETDEGAKRDQAQKEALQRFLETQHANLQNTAIFGGYHQALQHQEEAKYKQEQEKWKLQQSLAQRTQASCARQAQRAATAPQGHSLQRDASVFQAGAPPRAIPSGKAKPRKSTAAGPTKVSTKPKANNARGSKSFAARLASSDVSFVEWTALDYVEQKHHLGRKVATNVAALFKEDNTPAFIAVYRRDPTSGMTTDELRDLKRSFDTAKRTKEKANRIVGEVDERGKWTAQFHTFVHSIRNLNELKELHSVLNSDEAKLVERLKLFNLGATSSAVMNGWTIEPTGSLVKPGIEGLRTEEQARDSVLRILADTIVKDEKTFGEIRALRVKHAAAIDTAELTDSRGNDNEPDGRRERDAKYRYFYNFTSSVDDLLAHQILDINSGESQKILSVKIDVPAQFEADFKDYCKRRYASAYSASPRHKALLTAAFDRAWCKSVKPSVCRLTREDLNERARIGATDDIVRNARQLFLTPPITGKLVVGVYPGFQQGCGLAVLSENGNVLQTDTVRPHDTDNPGARHEAQRVLVDLVRARNCTIFGLANGAAARETEIFLTDLIAKRAFAPLDVAYTLVEEDEATIYAKSREADSEFPGLDANVRSAIFVARFLQNPMAELVKIEPQRLRVGMYKKRLPFDQWIGQLNEVITETVSLVGVDVNTAPISLLRRVAGLNESKAKNIIEWRKKSGPFRTRNDLRKVRGVCDKTFEQCAGFVRIIPETIARIDKRIAAESLDYFDQTCIHPEFYAVARAFLTAASCSPSLIGTRALIFAMTLHAEQGYSALANRFGTSVETMKLIVEALSIEKGFDVRGKPHASAFRRSFESIDKLRIGTILTGVVRNHVPSGAFVNVGLETDGLIHNSKMGGVALRIGQRVQVKVNSIEQQRGRIGLTLVKCI